MIYVKPFLSADGPLGISLWKSLHSIFAAAAEISHRLAAPSWDSRGGCLYACPSPGVFHGLREFVFGQRVQDVFFGEPGTSGLQDSEANLVHV